MHLLIFGCGYSGLAIAESFASGGARTSGTSRFAEKALALKTKDIQGFVFDGNIFTSSLIQEMKTVTHLVQSIAPTSAGDPVAALCHDSIHDPFRALFPNLQWIGYLSTVGVYGDHQGSWVDEETPLSPLAERSHHRVQAEQSWISLGKENKIPVSILRLAGIYGPGRNAFCNLENGTARRVIKPQQVFNRVRAEDIGAATYFLAKKNSEGIFNISDDQPCPPQDVVTAAAQIMGVTPPLEQSYEVAELSTMALPFYQENKRVSNKKLRHSGFRFQYPTYQMSLQQLWDTKTWP